MVGTDTTTNNVLVIGSMQNVEAYQNKVLEMKSQVGLRSEMLDRILDQGLSFFTLYIVCLTYMPLQRQPLNWKRTPLTERLS